MRPTPVTDLSPAGWIVDAVDTFAVSVLSLLPSGFDTYIRVFHPAYRDPEDEWKPVSWAEIAAANGKVAHSGMQLCALTGSERFEQNPQPGVYAQAPYEGTLPPELAASLASALEPHTTTPNDCFFAVWNGWGAIAEQIRRGPTFGLPNREYHLLHGTVTAAAESILEPPSQQTANLWWPADHAWCVATEIDLKSTYIGCNARCSQELLRLDTVEALPIDPATGIDWRSDRLNPFEEDG